MKTWTVALLLLLTWLPPAPAQDAGKALAEKTRVLFQRYCNECHGQTKLAGTFDINDYKTLLGKSRKGKTYLSQAGKDAGLKDSYLWAKIDDGSMPQDGEMAGDDKSVFKAWIEAGAPAWAEVATKRERITQTAVLRAIYDDLKDAEEEDRPFYRYFVFDHLHNNPKIDDASLARFKAALSKALNGMHWRKPIVIPRAVKNGSHAVFAIDLRDLDWDKKAGEKFDRWTAMLYRYPYGLRFDDSADDALSKIDRDLHKLTRGQLVYLRGDWFVAVATRPPLYETVLRLPPNAAQLEHKLGVDVASNFRRNRLARAGFTRSGISEQHRAIERHDSLYGAYWRSYDFKKDGDKGDLLKFPLGPNLPSAYGGKFPYLDVAFQQDGGEMIFHLPNGMQGYYLTKADDTYLDKGPIDVVQDKLRTSGTPEIVNGLSCMYCHSKGLIDTTTDQIRNATAVSGEARRKVRRLYASDDAMRKFYDADNELFRAAATKAMRPFLGSEKELAAAFEDKTEPIGEVARRFYNPDLMLDTAASEMGFATPEALAAVVEANETLRELGLLTLTRKGTVKRESWESIKGRSLFQRAMLALGKGTPWNFR